MITLIDKPTVLASGALLSEGEARARGIGLDEARKNTLASVSVW